MSSALGPLVLTASLFGGGALGDLFGGGDDCRHSDAMGARTMQTIVREWPLRLAADPVRRYVRDLGAKLGQTADGSQNGLEWRFFVVRNLEPTAFAVGGRRFVISDGLIAFVRNESDLAAVLAHEIAHQRLGHFCRAASPEATRFQYGSIVQHFDLAVEKAADVEAVGLLAMSGFDPASMYQVLRCLSQRPGASTHQLRARMQALAVFDASSSPVTNRSTTEFETIRQQVVQDLSGSVRRCR